MCVCVCIYIYMRARALSLLYIHIYIHTHIYMQIDRQIDTIERESARLRMSREEKGLGLRDSPPKKIKIKRKAGSPRDVGQEQTVLEPHPFAPYFLSFFFLERLGLRNVGQEQTVFRTSFSGQIAVKSRYGRESEHATFRSGAGLRSVCTRRASTGADALLKALFRLY